MGRSGAGGKTKTGSAGTTTVAAGSRFDGDLHAEGPITVAGHVKGRIEAADRVTVVTEGYVEGEIQADVLCVVGLVRGRVRCRSLEIRPGGRVLGEVASKELSIDAGGQFLGKRTAPYDQQPAMLVREGT